MVKMNKTAHDTTVIAWANKFERDGYEVMADVDGFPRPYPILDYIPDVFARKGSKIKIFEVETNRSYKRDITQRKAFKKFASLNRNVAFKTIIVKG